MTEVCKLHKGGADIGLLAANTPHIVFNEILKQSPIPLISIVEATCEEAISLGLKRLGLFGTRFTMQGRFYSEVFSKYGVGLVVPREDEQEFIHEKHMNELLNGTIVPETRERLVTIANRLRQQESIDGLILAGTELPLILHYGMVKGLPFLDTTQIHVRSAVSLLMK